MSTNRTCPACNEEVMQGDEYCAACGASLSGFWMSTWTSPPPQNPAAADDQGFIPLPLPQATQRDTHRSRTLIGLIVAAIVLLGGILAMTYLLTREDEERETQSSASGSSSLDTSLTEIADLTGSVVVPVAKRIERSPTPHPGTTSGSSRGHPEVASINRDSPSFTRLVGGSSEARIVDVLITTIRDEGGRDNTAARPLP
ncbi:MAG TPA: zinc ribbon domain-containing protein [Thermomicrobiales bacterium]|nr:zinc ribbon domain-containing protein [Thermomicrobiales bacterium]